MGKEKVDVLIKGGKASAAPPIGPSLSPLGVNIGNVVSEINEKTKMFDGMDVPVKIIVDTKTKGFEIEIGTPPVSSMIRKEMNVKNLAVVKEGKKTLPGDISMDSIIKIAKGKQGVGTELKSCVKQILGTCLSGGVTVNGKSPRDIQKEIDEGKISIG